MLTMICAMQHQQHADDAKHAGQLIKAMALYKEVAEMWPTVETFLDCAQCAKSLDDHKAVVGLPGAHHHTNVLRECIWCTGKDHDGLC